MSEENKILAEKLQMFFNLIYHIDVQKARCAFCKHSKKDLYILYKNMEKQLVISTFCRNYWQ